MEAVMLRYITLLCVAMIAASPAQSKTSTAPVAILDRDGYHVRYTTSLVAGDKIDIRGENTDEREPFELIVDARGRVRGSIGYQAVDFTVPVVQRDAIVASLKQGAPVAQATTPGSAVKASLR
jgi:hypothetical protein